MSKKFKYVSIATHIKPVINRGSKRKDNKKMSIALDKAWREGVLNTIHPTK